MNLNYAIFRSQGINTTYALSEIGAHNERLKKAYQSNKDIKIELSKNNIELVPLNEIYLKAFDKLTKNYKQEHEEKMKTTRKSRQKKYHAMLSESKNVVADELLFTSTHEFFNDMNDKDIRKWADTCMEFVYEDLGYTKDQVLHAVVHMDEKTPHVHCVVVPLIKKFDKRTNTERYTISKKKYIRDKIHLSELQDKYYKRLTDKGFELERGIKGSDTKHIKINEYKRLTSKINKDLNVRNTRLDKAMTDLESKMKTNKETIFDKEYVKVKRETFDSMNKVIDESKKVMELQPKLQTIFNEVDNYASSYKSLEKENQQHIKEVNALEKKNNNLEMENNSLLYRLNQLFELLKKFLRKLLFKGNDKTKDDTSELIKDYYDNEEFDMADVVGISRGTTKQDELFDYVEAPDYLKTRIKDYKEYEEEKNDIEMSL